MAKMPRVCDRRTDRMNKRNSAQNTEAELSTQISQNFHLKGEFANILYLASPKRSYQGSLLGAPQKKVFF